MACPVCGRGDAWVRESCTCGAVITWQAGAQPPALPHVAAHAGLHAVSRTYVAGPDA